MRLRTFDGGGAFSSSADIKDQLPGAGGMRRCLTVEL